MAGLSSSKEPTFDSRRYGLLVAFVLFAFLVLIGRVYHLQISRGAEYAAKSQSNFVQERRLPHSRGLIYDQAGRILVDNRPSHDVYMTVAFLPDSERALKRLAKPLGLYRDELRRVDEEILKRVVTTGTDVILVAATLDGSNCRETERIAEQYEIPGVLVEWRSGDSDDGCRVLLQAREFPSRAAVFERLRQLMQMKQDEMQALSLKALRKTRGLGRFKPTLLLEDITFESYATLRNAVALGELPGISLQDSQRRRYLFGSLGAHVLGFMNEIGDKELKIKKERGYRLGDQIGRRGLESAYESTLRGIDGMEPVVVDAKGREQGESLANALLGVDRKLLPEAGQGLVLSIDADLQRTAEDGFLGRAGSVVALEANTGFVVAMASFPDFNPNLVTGRGSAAVRRELNANKHRPWGNKAIQDHYAPGSTFKAITAIAGLREGLIHEHTHKNCPGFFRLGRTTWRCYNRAGHGPIALLKALQYSCDSYFYSLGYEMGPEAFAATARLMGFGAKTGIGIDREIPGIIPDRAYYEQRLGAYTPGLVVNTSIGQGDVTVTPLQLAVAYAAIANGGAILRPQLVREVRDANGALVTAMQPEIRAQLEADGRHLELVLESLAHVTDEGGTAEGLLYRKDMPEVSEWLRNSGIKIGGKTGTAQVVRLSKNIAHLDPEAVAYARRDHAWFVALVPAEKPELVVVVMTEHGGFGGSMSAPVAARLAHAWYTRVRGRGRYALEESGLPRALEMGDENQISPREEGRHGKQR